MLALTAAHITLSAKIKGTRHVDIFEVRTIQCRSAILKLSEMIRLLGILERNLDKREEDGQTIIPLVNYLLSLCEGPIFSVNPVLRKRFNLLNEFKVCRQNEVNVAFPGSNVEYDIDFAPIVVNLSQLKDNIYNSNLQRKILGCLRAISQNAIVIYDRKLKSIAKERPKRAISEPPSDEVPLGYEAIDDLLKPHEVGLFVDLAVLINDREKDTSLKSLRKLHFQVLAKFLSTLNEEVLPVMRTYFSQLQRVCSNKGSAVARLKELPHWKFTIHRMYAYIYRILCVLDIIISLTRQLWLPNKDYFYSLRSQLSSRNVYAYKEVLNKVDSVCHEPKRYITGNIIEILDDWSKPTLNINVSSNSVWEIFVNSIRKVSPILGSTLEVITSWLEVWKFIEDDSVSYEKLGDFDEEQLSNMLQEKLITDKPMEDQQKMTKLNPAVIISPPVESPRPSLGSRAKKSPTKRPSTPTSPNTSNSTNTPNKLSITTMNRTTSAGRLTIKGTSPASPQLSKKKSIESIKIHSPTPVRRSTSPQAPRRNSTVEGGSIHKKKTGDPKNASKSTLENRVDLLPDTSSLDFSNNHGDMKTYHKTLNPRYNSSQSGDVAGQDKLQDGFLILSINGTSNISTFKKPQVAKKPESHIDEQKPFNEILDFRISSEISEKGEDPNMNFLETIECNAGIEEETGKPSLFRSLDCLSTQKQSQENLEKPAFNEEHVKSPQGQESPLDCKVLGEKIKERKCEKPKDGESKKTEQSTKRVNQVSPSSQVSGHSPIRQLVTNSPVIQKKVRFIGVGPITKDELTRPSRKGWYKKSAILQYPRRPPNVAIGDSGFVKKA